MKKIFHSLFISLLLLLLSGCLTTLYPIFQEKDIVFNENLLGYWKYTEGKEKEKKFIEYKKIPMDRRPELPPGIRGISDKGYWVSRMDSLGQTTGEYFVFLAKIEKNYYLDYYPAESPAHKIVGKNYKDHIIKVHSSYKCDFTDKDHFEIKQFAQSFLDKLISDNKINIRHEVVEGKNIITASTEDLQKFIIPYGNNPKAYEGDVTYCTRIIDY